MKHLILRAILKFYTSNKLFKLTECVHNLQLNGQRSQNKTHTSLKQLLSRSADKSPKNRYSSSDGLTKRGGCGASKVGDHFFVLRSKVISKKRLLFFGEPFFITVYHKIKQFVTKQSNLRKKRSSFSMGSPKQRGL